MLDMGRRLQRIMNGKTRPMLEEDDMVLGLAIIRTLEIIGEAASRVSTKTRETYPQIAWRQIIGMRNYLIHAYMNVDLNVVWDTATHSVPELVEQLEKTIPPEPPESSGH